MTRKIFRSGNSAVVSIPQESLEALGLEVGSEVEVIVDADRGRLILRPVEAPPGADVEFSRRLNDFIDRYGLALDALADLQVRYLSPEQVLYIHHVLTEGAGLRDAGALQSAVARSRSGSEDGEFYKTVFEKAAALLHSLLDDHPFVDGNRRTAITAAGLLLEYNGRTFTATNEELEQFARSVVTEDPTVAETACWLRAHRRPLRPAATYDT